MDEAQHSREAEDILTAPHVRTVVFSLVVLSTPLHLRIPQQLDKLCFFFLKARDLHGTRAPVYFLCGSPASLKTDCDGID